MDDPARAPQTDTHHASATGRQQQPPGLYVVATPIGNLGDITARALEMFKAADAIACEDSRVTGHLLRQFGIKATLIRYDDHAGERTRPDLLERLAQGQRIVLVSDAGTPMISDPGYKLVEEALAAGHRVIPIPGASALLAGLAAAGLPTASFYFGGFLPQKTKARRDSLSALSALPASLVFYESPKRLASCLADAAEVLGNRRAVVARELTKLFEEFTRGSLADLAAHYSEIPAPKGEAVLLIGPPDQKTGPDPEDLDAALRKALVTLSVKDASAQIASEFGLPRKEVYQRALTLKAANES